MKTNNKHTPGPWKVLYSSNKYPSIHSGDFNKPVAVLYEYVSEADRDLLDNSNANAALIAAAPEMLEALELINQWASGFGYKNINLIIEPIIKKARGE